jgi:hypothetical protein
MITTIQTSTGKCYNLSKAERDWVAGFGTRSSEALICIQHALVYYMFDAEWLTDVTTENAECRTQTDDLSFKFSQSIAGYCNSIINRCISTDTNFSEIIELAHMQDGTPCCLLIWRHSTTDYGIGRPFFWIRFSCDGDGMVTSMTKGFYPSVLSFVRSGIFPGIPAERLQQLAAFRHEKLPREQSYFFTLIGFPFSKELEEAEKIVSEALAEFPGSELLIYDVISRDDPQLFGQFRNWGINSIPHLSITWKDDPIFRLGGPFSSESLAKELDQRFLPAKALVQHQFKLCDDCLEKYRALKYDPQSSFHVPLLPSTPFNIASDEHPGEGLKTVNHSKPCRDWICYLLTARDYLWEHGFISEKHKVIWDEARQVIPNWPGFERLTMDMTSLESEYNVIKEIREAFHMYEAAVTYECIATGFVMWHGIIRHSSDNEAA